MYYFIITRFMVFVVELIMVVFTKMEAKFSYIEFVIIIMVIE